jgi:hypothetical protein
MHSYSVNPKGVGAICECQTLNSVPSAGTQSSSFGECLKLAPVPKLLPPSFAKARCTTRPFADPNGKKQSISTTISRTNAHNKKFQQLLDAAGNRTNQTAAGAGMRPATDHVEALEWELHRASMPRDQANAAIRRWRSPS